MSITTVYLIYYPKDIETKKNLQALNLAAIYLMVYTIALIFTVVELKNTTLFFAIIISLAIFLIASLILVYVYWKICRHIAVGITIGIITIVLCFDLFFISGDR